MQRPSYDEFTRRLRTAAEALGGSATAAAEADGYPLYHLVLPGPGDAPRFLLSAGIHGEEPGSPTGFLHWLEHDAARWLRTFRIEAFPCLNPYGFERGLRHDKDGRDLNRRFRDEDPPPAIGMVRRILEGKRFAMAVDMHEDCDYYGFYLYERLPKGPAIAPALLTRVALEGPISHGEEGDEPPIERGMVKMDWTQDVSWAEWMQDREEWPLAFYLYQMVDHVITVETPGRQPLDVRVRMQRAAVETALSFTQARLGL